MPITIGSNIASLTAQRQLGQASESLAKVSERLASGQRINRASDDAAGLAIASTLNADGRILNQAIRNLNDGISAHSIADSAVSELSNIVTRLMELAEQSANGTYSSTQRKPLNDEAQALRNEYHRIVAATKFNDRSVLGTTASEMYLQAGRGDNTVMSVRTQVETVAQEDVSGAITLDGSNDYVEVTSTENLEYRGGDFTIEAWIYNQNTDAGAILSKPWNGAGYYNYSLQISAAGQPFIGVGANYYDAYVLSTKVAPINQWTHVAVTRNSQGDLSLWVGGELQGSTYASDFQINNHGGFGDANIPLAIGTIYPYGSGWGGLSAHAFQGSIDEVRISNSVRYTSNFTPQNFAFVPDSNTMGLFHFEEGSGTSTNNDISSGGAGVMQNGAAFTTASAFTGTDYGSLFAFTLNTAEASRDALDKLKQHNDLLAKARGRMGADRSRLDVALANLQVAKENYAAAEGRIIDADIASEAADLTRQTILQRTAASVLAQANQQPALALQLLRGN